MAAPRPPPLRVVQQCQYDATVMERLFVAKYEQLPLLWKKDHPDYGNKFKRNLAYDLLVPILRRIMPTANRLNVRQKINILRSTYRKEVRRYLASRTITADGEIVYTYNPPSWKFEAMKFLFHQNENDSKMEIPQSEIEEEPVEDDSFNDFEDQELVYIQEVEGESENHEYAKKSISPEYLDEHSPIVVRTVEFIDEHKPVVKTARKRTKYNIINDKNGMALNKERYILDQECSAVGSNVSCKLQRMDIDQRLFAESLINKVLLMGLQNSLTAMIDLTDTADHKPDVEDLDCIEYKSKEKDPICVIRKVEPDS